MLPEHANIIAHRARRSYIRTHHLVRIEAKDRVTGDIEALGIWDGEDNQIFNVDGTGNLVYIGAGRVLQLPDFQYEIGLDARTYEIGLSQTDEGVASAVRGYDPRFGDCRIYRTEWDGNGGLLAPPRLVFKGFVDGTPETTPAIGSDSGALVVKITSDAAKLTFYGSPMKNHEFQKRRSGDNFRRYSSVTNAPVPWGMKWKTTKQAIAEQRVKGLFRV